MSKQASTPSAYDKAVAEIRVAMELHGWKQFVELDTNILCAFAGDVSATIILCEGRIFGITLAVKDECHERWITGAEAYDECSGEFLPPLPEFTRLQVEQSAQALEQWQDRN